MSHNICKSVALAVASLSVVLSVGSASAQAETFFVQEGVALNTNNNFSRIDGNPRMSIYRQNNNDADQQFDRLSGNRGGTLLKHRSTGKCLNAHYLTQGSQINVWPCDANDADQNWNIVDAGNNFNLIKRTGTNLCVDTPTRDNQGIVHLINCDGNNGNQRWKSSVSTSVSSGSTPLLTRQGIQYFKDRLQFYGNQGNPYSRNGFGSSVIGTSNGHEGNCTWYAYGRLKELGFNPDDIKYGNANEWADVLHNGARILSRNETPQFGDVAQWYKNGQNHVAIVEKVENGNVTLSESHYTTDYDGDVDGNPNTIGTLHRVVTYTVNNPERYIRLSK